MNLPDTTVSRTGRQRSSRTTIVLVVVIAVLSGFLGMIFLGPRGFSPGEDISSESVQEVSASLEDAAYPPRDILVFEGGAQVVYLYLSVSNLDPDEEMSVDVERVSGESLFGRLSGKEVEIEVAGGRENQLAPSGNGVSGVIKFEVRAADRNELPVGDYTVDVTEGETQAVEKRFVVRE